MAARAAEKSLTMTLGSGSQGHLASGNKRIAVAFLADG